MDDLILCYTFIHVCRQLQTQVSSVSPLQACGYSCTLTVCLCVVGVTKCRVYKRGRWFFYVVFFVVDVFFRTACFLFFLSLPDLSFRSTFCNLFLLLALPSHITNAHTQWTAISDASPIPAPLFPPVALLQPHLLCIHPILFVTGRL